MPSTPRFLLVRFSAIGDCVMAAWAATSIRNRFPDAEITWVVESRCASVVDDQKLVSCLHAMPRDRWKASRLSPSVWREQMRSYITLRRRGYDFGIDLQGHAKTALCLRIAAPKLRLAARATDPFARALNPTLTEPHEMHTVDWNHQVLCRFGDFVLPDRPLMPLAGTRNTGKVTLSVGAGHAPKQYPREGWLQVAKRMRDAGYEVRVLGGPRDESLGDESVNLVGKLTLRETMEEVATSSLHFAADTGTGHMAAAYDTPVVSVFGPTEPYKYHPYGEKVVVLRKSDNPADVTPDEIVASGLELLGQP